MKRSRESYNYLVRALRTFPPAESNIPQARKLALRAVKSALNNPNHFDFQDLTALDPVQALRKSDPVWFELLEIFNGKLLDDFDDFRTEHDEADDDDDNDDDDDDDDESEEENRKGKDKGNQTWLEQHGLDDDVLYRKMRLLTLTSLAAASPTRSVPYSSIAHALQIPSADVEMWVIDVVRAGLVEGKLSQQGQTLLIHRATHRLFGEKQWRQVAARLDTWRESLVSVLAVLRSEREHAQAAAAAAAASAAAMGAAASAAGVAGAAGSGVGAGGDGGISSSKAINGAAPLSSNAAPAAISSSSPSAAQSLPASYMQRARQVAAG
jgi:translation initiation factor 3 subunit M